MKIAWESRPSLYRGATIYTLDLGPICCDACNTSDEPETYSIKVYLAGRTIRSKRGYSLEVAKKWAERECRKRLTDALKKLDGGEE